MADNIPNSSSFNQAPPPITGEEEPSPPAPPLSGSPDLAAIEEPSPPLPVMECESPAAIEEREPPSPLAPKVLESESPLPPTATEQSESSAAGEEVAAADQSEKKTPVEDRKVPQSLISFKEESNIVADLSDTERKALQELKQLVQEALSNHQFSEPTSDSSKTEPPNSESDAITETKPTHEPKIEENPAKVKESEEVLIWGIPLLEDDRSDVILLKFLRARDFKVKDAFIMIKNTVRFRKEMGIDALVEEDLGDDLDKVVFMHGHDREGHPVCYNVYGEFQNKELYQKTFGDEEKRSKFMRWRTQFLERSIRKLDFSPGGVNTLFQVNDLKNAPGPGKRELRLATKQALEFLQDNYPEFVAKQVFINAPWWYLAFYTMIGPFLTQRTKSKFVFASPSKTAETLFKYISPEQVPIQYGGLSVDYCDCNPEFSMDDPATEITVKPGTKQTVEIIIYEKCIIVWELRVVGWEVSYGAEFVPNDADKYTVIIQKSTKMAPTDEPVVSNSFKVGELGKVLLTIDNPTSKKKTLLYRFNVKPFCE